MCRLRHRKPADPARWRDLPAKPLIPILGGLLTFETNGVQHWVPSRTRR